jgi:hypothetical protein
MLKAVIYARVSHISRLLALPCPALEAIGKTVEEQPRLPGV